MINHHTQAWPELLTPIGPAGTIVADSLPTGMDLKETSLFSLATWLTAHSSLSTTNPNANLRLTDASSSEDGLQASNHC